MTIEFSCSHCGHRLKTHDGAAGKSGRCKQCGTQVTVPRSAATGRVAARSSQQRSDAQSPPRDSSPRRDPSRPSAVGVPDPETTTLSAPTEPPQLSDTNDAPLASSLDSLSDSDGSPPLAARADERVIKLLACCGSGVLLVFLAAWWALPADELQQVKPMGILIMVLIGLGIGVFQFFRMEKQSGSGDENKDV